MWKSGKLLIISIDSLQHNRKWPNLNPLPSVSDTFLCVCCLRVPKVRCNLVSLTAALVRKRKYRLSVRRSVLNSITELTLLKYIAHCSVVYLSLAGSVLNKLELC